MNQLVIIGRVNSGKFSKGEAVRDALAKNEGKLVTVVVYDGEKRNLGQNAFFHLCLSYICKVTGETIEIEKMNFKDRYGLYDDVLSKQGEVKRIYHKTSEMSVSKFKEVTDWLKADADFVGAVLPDYEQDY